jgi:hypothetical protein
MPRRAHVRRLQCAHSSEKMVEHWVLMAFQVLHSKARISKQTCQNGADQRPVRGHMARMGSLEELRRDADKNSLKLE